MAILKYAVMNSSKSAGTWSGENVDVSLESTANADTDVSRYNWHDDLTISRKHLRIHCILYEQDPVSDIAPFVYATDISANGTYLKKSNAECNGSQGRGILMGKNGTFLLDDGDELRLSETVTLTYRAFGTVKQTVLSPIQEREKAILSSRYLITGRLLGEGGYGKVLIGIDQKTQRQLACKIVNLEKLYDRRTMASLRMPTSDGQWSPRQAMDQLPRKVQSCFREFDILKNLSHPNIVHIQKVFWSQSTIYMFQELVTGGDLFSYIEYKHGRIPSIESAVIIRQILKGVQYLHDQDIVHRDLKPDNILMTSLDRGARVVITDFGNARFLPNANTQNSFRNNKLKRMFSLVGTLEYTAPEIHKANWAIPSDYGYSLSVDMWSIGSITACILTGEQIFGCRQNGPFEEDARRVIIGLAAQCDLSILDDEHHPLWGPIASAPKDFIRRLLVLEEEDRMSASEALNHIWFTHPYMAAEFDAQYERSIRDWHPRHKDDQLIEQISTLEPSPVAPKAPEDNPVFASAPNFFVPKSALVQNIHSNQCPCKEEPELLGRSDNTDSQCASQRTPFSNDTSCTDNRAQYYGLMNAGFGFDDLSASAPDRTFDEQQACVDHAMNESPMPQTNVCGSPSIISAGRLQRVSTSTRSKCFQKEIIDLDDLEGPSDLLGEAIGSPHSNRDKLTYPQSRERLHQEDSVQVRTTPYADDEGDDSKSRWWHERYPQTQFHYDTHAEPITQEEDSILVQETPPEVFTKPLQPRSVDTSVTSHAFEQHSGHRRAHEANPSHEANKRRKFYGRKN